jgi:hypothetical protein
MKKISQEQLIRNHIAGEHRGHTTFVRKRRRYNPNRYSEIRTIGNRTVIIAPSQISIYDFSDNKKKCSYTQTMAFLENLKKLKKRNCLVDFSNTKTISAAALVLVYAAIENAVNNRTGKADIVWSKKHHHVNQGLKSTNIHKLITNEEISYDLGEAKHLPVISSVGSNHMEEILDFIQQRIYKTMKPNTEYIYGDAVSETINNVGLHAYPGAGTSEKKWWLMCTTIGKNLYLAIYDNGVGIPKTVVDRPWFLASLKSTHPKDHDLLMEKFPDLEKSGFGIFIPTVIPDERLIRLSMQGDVSGTKKEKHGQGSKSIMALVSDTPDGKLWVFSNNGLYTFWQIDQSPGEKKLPKKFPGTLVQWNIKIS